MAVLVVIFSRIGWKEMSRGWLFIGVFIIFFSMLTFLTGRGGMELYTTEHLIRNINFPFSIFGWQPVMRISWEKTFYALSMILRVFSLASMTILYALFAQSGALWHYLQRFGTAG